MNHCHARVELQRYDSDDEEEGHVEEVLIGMADDVEEDDVSLSASDGSFDSVDEDELVLEGGDRYYTSLQELIYMKSFSMDALFNSTSLETFIDALPQYSDKDKTMADLINFKSKANLSREVGNSLLELINSFEPRRKVPKDWRALSRYVDHKCKPLQGRTLRQGVPWPAEWEMETWDQGGHDYPLEVELIVRDPLELIALKLVCPTTQYIWKDHIMYEYEERHITDSEVKCWSDLMTSNYAKYTQASVRALDPEGVLLCIVTYADAVTMGLRGKVSLC